MYFRDVKSIKVVCKKYSAFSCDFNEGHFRVMKDSRSSKGHVNKFTALANDVAMYVL